MSNENSFLRKVKEEDLKMVQSSNEGVSAILEGIASNPKAKIATSDSIVRDKWNYGRKP